MVLTTPDWCLCFILPMNVKVTIRAVCLLLFFIFITLESSVCLRAQIDDKEKAEKEAAKQKELEKKTLNLLDEVIGAAWGLKLPANRSYVLATAADLLWPHDEKRARNLFWEALNNLNFPAYAVVDETKAKDANKSAKPTGTNAPTKEQLQELNQYYATLETRREFLHRVARRDPQLALDMLRSMRQPPPPQFEGTFRA